MCVRHTVYNLKIIQRCDKFYILIIHMEIVFLNFVSARAHESNIISHNYKTITEMFTSKNITVKSQKSDSGVYKTNIKYLINLIII